MIGTRSAVAASSTCFFYLRHLYEVRTVTVEENKAIVRRIIEEGWRKDNLESIRENYAPNYVWHTLQGDINGIESVVQFANVVIEAFPDFQMTIEDIVAEGDKVVVRGLHTGTHQGEFMGIPATGKKISYPAMTIITLVDGKFGEAWMVNDRLAMYQQLGATPPKE